MSTSASSAHRWLACPASEALPHAKERGGEAAARGIAIHRYLQAVTNSGRVMGTVFLNAALDRAREDGVFEAVQALDLDALPTDPAMYSAEMWMAWHPMGTYIPLRGDEAALLTYTGQLTRAGATAWLDRHGFFFGAADVAAIDPENRRGLIVDYKTGEGFVEHPRDNAQISGLAFLLARTANLDEVDARIIRLPPGEEPIVMRHVFDQAALFEVVERTIRAGLARVAEARGAVAMGLPPQVFQGEHCRYCPAFTACPAKTALVKALAASPEAIEAEVRALLTPENTGVAYIKLRAIEDLVGRLKSAVRDAAVEFDGVPLPDGRTYGPVPGPREITHTGKAHVAISREFCDEIADAAVVSKMTLSSLEAAATKPLLAAMEIPSKKEFMTRALAALASEGVLSQGEPTVRAHR